MPSDYEAFRTVLTVIDSVCSCIAQRPRAACVLVTEDVQTRVERSAGYETWRRASVLLWNEYGGVDANWQLMR